MAMTIPLTNLAKYMKVAEVIHRDFRKSPASPAAVR